MITDDLDEDDRRALRAVGMELELVKPIAAPVTFPVSG
jgi:hypothetical protein